MWKCTHCDFATRGEAVRRVFATIQADLDAADAFEPCAESCELREQLFRKYRSVLHPRNAYNTMLRHALCQLYGRVEGYGLSDLPDILLERKIELCRDLLAVADVVEPGYSRLRGMILYELHAPIMLFARSRFQFGEMDDKCLRIKLEETAAILKEAVDILSMEDPNSPEGMIAVMGQQSLEQLKTSIETLPK